MTKLRASAMPSAHVLRPYNPAEVCSIAEAAAFLGISEPHARRVVERYDIGRRVRGRAWRVSRIGLLILADSDQSAPNAFHARRRDDPALQAYVKRAALLGVPASGKTAA